jgi:hypothetical protein
MTPTQCPTCNTAVIWTHTVLGTRMLVDAVAQYGALLRLTTEADIVRATPAGPAIDLFDLDDDGTRHQLHQCPPDRVIIAPTRGAAS